MMILAAAACSKSGRGGETPGGMVKYNDRQNPHAKMNVPMEFSWEHDKVVQVGFPIQVHVKVTALQTAPGARLKAALGPNLTLQSGFTETPESYLAAGQALELSFVVIPTKEESFEIAVHGSMMADGSRMGTARTITFTTQEYQAKKPEDAGNYVEDGGRGLTVLPGRTTND